MLKKYDSLFALLQAFPDEESCVRHLEQLRWPHGVICPCCGCTGSTYKLTRGSIYKCGDCGKQFSVRKGTIFEESRLPLQKWFMAVWLVTNARKGIASTQLAREIGVTQKTAWFMLGRLREVAASMGETGGPIDGTVEADETWIGGKEKNKHRSKRSKLGRGPAGKLPVLGAINRDGRVRAVLADDVTKYTIHQFIRETVSAGANLHTDESKTYLGLDGYNHSRVNHAMGEYVNGDVHTNTCESFWAMLKRGHYGIFHQMSQKHLHRYLNEFAARWNMTEMTGAQRLDSMLEATPGLRLTYERLIA